MDCGRGTQHGLLTASFVPSQEQQDLRDLTRLLLSPGARTNAARQSGPTSVLEEAGLKLSSVRSSVMGLSGRAILHALCAGESDPQRLAELMHPSVHATQEQVVAALTAEVREHHRYLLRELLMLIDAQDRSITHLELEIERHLHPSARAGATLRKDHRSQPTRLVRVDGGGRNRFASLSSGSAS